MKWFHRLFLALSLLFGVGVITNTILQRQDMLMFSIVAFGFSLGAFVALPND